MRLAWQATGTGPVGERVKCRLHQIFAIQHGERAVDGGCVRAAGSTCWARMS
jgi:hypothetical protein